MAVKQISIYLDNRSGELAKVTKLLSDAGINLRSMCIADTERFGVLRVIADDPVKADEVLKAAGETFRIRELVAFSMPDRAGGLSEVLSVLAENDINMEYLYALITGKDRNKACAVMRVEDNEKTERILRENGIEVLSEEDI